MALHSFHQTFSSLIRPSVIISSLRLRSPAKICAAFMTSKEFRDPNIKKRKPWPYETRGFKYWHMYIDHTPSRFDENTKVIVVDGNIAAGKTTFAQKLAEEFDLKYFPESSIEHHFRTPYGHDLREIDDLMPPTYKACDLKVFYSNPHHQNVTKFQNRMFLSRFKDYMQALAHVLNTGQGVVMDRSVFSDFVFMETMYRAGYISQPARDLYKAVYKKAVRELLRPHLIIYLDVPVETVMERIKTRNNPIEVDSPVLTKEYLQTIEDVYKTEHLKGLSEHSEILMYDWSHYGDMEVVVEDVEELKLDDIEKYEKKLSDWCKEDHWEWSHFRRMYTNNQNRLLVTTQIFRPQVTEFYYPNEDYLAYQEVLQKIPGMKYEKGFNYSLGEKPLFKMD